jgi:hypothetical protein
MRPMTDRDDRPPDPLESELRAWFKAAGNPAAPATMRALMARLGTETQPTERVHTTTFAWRGSSSGRLAAITSALAVVLVASWLLFGRGEQGPAVSPSSPIPSPFVSASPGPSSPPPTGTPVAPTPIDDGGIFSTSGLWAVVGQRLYLSTDQGVSWVPRTVVPGVALDVTSGNVLSSAFVLDATHAWTASPGTGSTVPYGGQGPEFDHLHVLVSRTTDGGATWHSVAIPGDWGGTQPVLAFADRQHGFLLLATLRGGPGSTAFATDDGGATWRRAGGLGTLGSVFGASDPSTLWSGNQGDAGPVERSILDVNDTLVAPPAFDGDAGAVAVLAGSTDNPPDARFYRTSDRGRTWVLAAQRGADQGAASVAVIDPKHFIIFDPSGLQTTSDGGATWQRSASTGVGAASRLRFWDPLDGAAVVQLSNGAAPAAGLLRTIDGGQTWTPVSITPGS